MRFVWVAIGLGAVAWSQRRFARDLRGAARVRGAAWATSAAVAGRDGRAASLEPAQAPPDPASLLPKPLAALGMTTSRPSFLSGLTETLRVELRELASQPRLYLFVPM